MAYGLVNILKEKARTLRESSVDEFGTPFITSLRHAYVDGFPLNVAEQANQNVISGLVEAMGGEKRRDDTRFLRSTVVCQSVEIMRASVAFILSHIFGNGPKIRLEFSAAEGEFLSPDVDKQLEVFHDILQRKMSIEGVRNVLESVIGNLFVFGVSARYKGVDGSWVVPRFTNLVAEGNNQRVTFAHFSMNLDIPSLHALFGEEGVKAERPGGGVVLLDGVDNTDFFFMDKSYEGLSQDGDIWEHGNSFVHYNGVGTGDWKTQRISSLVIDRVCKLSESPGAINLPAVDRNRNITSVTSTRLVPIATRLLTHGIEPKRVAKNFVIEGLQPGAKLEVVDGNLGQNADLWVSLLFTDSQRLAVQLGAPVPGEDVSSNEAALARRTYFSNLILPSVVSGVGNDLLTKYVLDELSSGGVAYDLLRDLSLKAYFSLPRDEAEDTLKAQKVSSLIQLSAAVGSPLVGLLGEYAKSLNIQSAGAIAEQIEKQRAAQQAQSLANQVAPQQQGQPQQQGVPA